MERYIDYVERQLAEGIRLNVLAKPVLGLFHALPNGRLFRRHLSENAHKRGATADVLREALEIVTRPAPARPSTQTLELVSGGEM